MRGPSSNHRVAFIVWPVKIPTSCLVLNFPTHASDALPPIAARMTGREVHDDSFNIEQLLERVEFVHSAATREWKKEEDELADMVEKLHEHMDAVADRYAEGKAQVDRCISIDTQRSENVKRKHEELIEEFRENFSSLVEPRSFFWRTLDKVGFYITLILSFTFVVPLTACYSKTLRFIRTRRRRFSNSRERPAWTTGHGEVEPDFVSSDFFGEGGLASLAVSPLRRTSSSLAGRRPQITKKVNASLSLNSLESKITVTKIRMEEQKSSDSSTGSDLNSAAAANGSRDDKVLNEFGSANGRRSRGSVNGREESVQSDSGVFLERLRDAELKSNGQCKKTKEDNIGWVRVDTEGWPESSNSTDFWSAFGDTGE